MLLGFTLIVQGQLVRLSGIELKFVQLDRLVRLGFVAISFPRSSSLSVELLKYGAACRCARY